jgi:LmbE family N-acetylglucosaminyl deacetylase
MNILVISAHPDDETLGCGGTLLRHVAQGASLYWLILTRGSEPTYSSDYLQCAREEVENVAKAYGIKQTFWPGLPSTGLDALPLNDVIAAVRRTVEEVRPDVVYTVHQGDVHTDHQVVFTATAIVLKPFYMRSLGVKRFLSFETLSSTDAAPASPSSMFAPNVYCDITPYIDRKLEIMRLFAQQVQAEPMPRSDSAIRALARVRGASISVPYAEAFMLIREVAII